MAPYEIICYTFLSFILHLLLLIFPIFTCVDPDLYSEYGCGSTKLLNTGTDPVLIRIQVPDCKSVVDLETKRSVFGNYVDFDAHG